MSPHRIYELMESRLTKRQHSRHSLSIGNASRRKNLNIITALVHQLPRLKQQRHHARSSYKLMASRVCSLTNHHIRAIIDSLFRGGQISHLDKHSRRRFKPLQQPNNLLLRPDGLMRRKEPHRRRLVLLDDWQSRGLEFDHGLVGCEKASADAEMAGGRVSVIAEELADLDELGIEPNNLR